MADPAESAASSRSWAATVALALLLAGALAAQLAYRPGEGPPWRRLWFDALQQFMPRERDVQPAVVVEIDEASLAEFGQWPWPRDYLAALVWRIHEAGARSIALDLLLSEPDRMSPRAFLQSSGIDDPRVVEALEALGDTDATLRDVVRRTPTALAAAGLIAEGPVPEHPDIGPRVIVEGIDPDDFLSFGHGIGPMEPLRLVAQGLGAISDAPNADQVLRRVAIAQSIVGRPFVLLGAEAQRIAGGADVARITPAALGLAIDLGGDAAQAEANGDFWLHFGRLDRARYLSAVDVLTGEPSAADRIEGRIVLVAVTGLGTVDLKLTPLREAVYGIEAHLQVIEQIVQQRFLRRPAPVFVAEIALTAALGLAAILLIPRARPFVSLATLGGAGLALASLSAVAFRQGLLLDAASPALGGGLVAAVQLGLTLVQRDRARLAAEIALERARVASARIDAELDAAWDIQKGLLPAPTRRIDGRLDLACLIRPARRVGGDFYDHFLIDERRLFFVVGDVSGKGIEASVFMGLSKALWKSAALRGNLPLDRILATANQEIARDNPRLMFVTGFAGILDLETGDLDFSGAGHESPFVFGAGATPRQTPDFSGLPAGLDADAVYPVGRLRLAPGEGLCVFSDGVSDAENPSREFFGLARLERRLASLPDGVTAQAAIDALFADVDGFAGAAPPSDDLTVMVLIRCPTGG